MKLALAALAALLPSAALANTDADAQVWTTLSATGSLSGPLMANVEIVGRASTDQGRFIDTQVMALLGTKLSKHVTVWIGYRRAIGTNAGQPTTYENRIREQININLGKVANGALSSRTMFEQRRREGQAGTAVRLRNQFKWSMPFKKGGKTDLVLSHEDFVNLNSAPWGVQSGYARMRNFVGIGTPVLPKLRGEFGYMNQWDIRRGTFDRVAHVAQFNLAYSF